MIPGIYHNSILSAYSRKKTRACKSNILSLKIRKSQVKCQICFTKKPTPAPLISPSFPFLER